MADAVLLLHADTLDDVEKMRISLENRLRSLTGSGESAGGHEWGKGVPADLPEVQVLHAHLEQVQALEHGATLALKRAMRRHHLSGWVKRTVGVGEKQAARLIAAIGDPASRANPSQLWAFAGLHVVPAHRPTDTHPTDGGDDAQISHTGHQASDAQSRSVGVAPTRQRGQRANWSTTAKTRVFLVAEACVKAGVRKTADVDDTDGYDTAGRVAITDYGRVYLDGRTKYRDAVHQVACKRCGPAGSPAPAGSRLSAGHQHARAMRLVMKEILLDLWREARRDGDER